MKQHCVLFLSVDNGAVSVPAFCGEEGGIFVMSRTGRITFNIGYFLSPNGYSIGVKKWYPLLSHFRSKNILFLVFFINTPYL